MDSRKIPGLKTSYLVGERVTLEPLDEQVHHVVALDAWGESHEARRRECAAVLDGLGEGTFSIGLCDEDGRWLAEDFTTVRRSPGEDPVMGFVTSFDAADRPEVLAWLADLRCTVVQVYDWMDSYSVPVATTENYQDPLGRRINVTELRSLISGIKEIGAVAQAYAPVCAADADVADAHADWRLYRNDAVPESLGDLLQVMNPASQGWQHYWIDQYSRALDTLGFNGFHLDTYGYPRAALDDEARTVDMASAYADFIDVVRRACPSETISFNQVNGVPRSLKPPPSPSFRYVEVWPPNTQWRHLESLLQRSAGLERAHGDTVAIYPPVWQEESTDALRTALISQAVLTTLGANALLWGDRRGALCHPYYVDHHDLSDAHADRVLEWHRFGLRVRDLFKIGIDTSWYELTDENAALYVRDVNPVSPEPVGGSLYVRVRRDTGRVAISLLDITGSPQGSWATPSAAGVPRLVDVSVLVEHPERWRAQVATLGDDDDRFREVDTEPVDMREGRGLLCRVPLIEGWTIVRLHEGEER